MNTKNLQKIYESKNSIIYKGKYKNFDKDVIIKVLNAEYPSEKQIIGFNNEYEFTKDLNISGVRKVINIDEINGKNILVLEYFKGKTVRKALNKLVNIENILKIAINITQTLGHIHQQNIIHKDINSNNILINKKNEINIIDFGLAGRYTLKTQNLSNPERLEGTLAYISPEQTGRMNRSIDYRTDLYSLGVVLYEMFTKKLPFQETDDMDLVHSHIAKMPIEPDKINANIPKFLSNIILKLLSKNAEDRYQSAFGLKHDLKQLINQQGFKNIEGRKLGEKDFSGKLTIPEKLYGRENEIKQLYKIYEKVSNGNKELLLLSGYSGVGKSALIHEIHKPLSKKAGFYIEGKFDLLQKNIPYRAVILAFTDFVNLILKEDDEKLNYWKNLIQKSVGNIGAVLTNLIPELELIIGKQPEIPKLDGKEAQNRFNYVWSNFIKAISAAKHPLVIFIDDLQWADGSSVELLKNLLVDPEIKYLFCIIAYRNNEINTVVLHEFENLKNLYISKIKLENIEQTDVNNLVKDSLANTKSEDIKKLSDLIYSKTFGNAFFTIQFFKNLYEEELLKFDFIKNKWKWNITEIKKQNITDNVIELMINKVRKLPKATLDILKIAACIGNRFHLKILSVIYKKNKQICKNDLETAIIENIIIPLDNQNYKFAHDRIQQAVYFTIPDSKKNNFHLQTGKLLLKFLDKESQTKQIFNIVNQLNYGISLMKNHERQQLSELNLKATMKAKQSSAYLPAYDYLKIANDLLEKNSWQTNYNFTLNIYNELAELSYLNGKYSKTEFYTKKINKNVSNILDKVNSYCSLINAYRAQSMFTESIQTGFKILSKFGINFPKKPSQLHIIFNFIKTSILLNIFGIDKFKNLPMMSNEHVKAQIKLIDVIGTSAYISNKKLVPLFITNVISLIIKYGHNLSSPYFISGYGIMMMTLNKTEQAYKFGKIAIHLQKKYNINQIKCSANYVNICFIKIWKTKLSEIIRSLVKNYKVGLEVGDSEFASYSLIYSHYYSLFAKTRLHKLKNKIDNDLIQIHRLNQKKSSVTHSILLQITSDLLNNYYNNIHSFTGKYFDNKGINDFIKEKDITGLVQFYISKSFILFVFNYIEKMEAVLDKLEEYKAGIMITYFYALANFYTSLCSLAIFENKNKSGQKEILKKVSENQKQMKIWAKHCPENFQNKYDIVEAEKFRILGKKELAESFYGKAIKGANKNNFLCEEAISWEAAGRFYLQEDNEILAKMYFQNAYKTYKIWGATAKLKQLENKYPQFIFEKQTSGSIISTDRDSTIISDSKTIIRESASLFDMTSIVKASHSLSGEVKLEKLLKTMLMLIMENAGADYAVIIRNENEKFLIEAKGKYGSENIELLQSKSLEKTEAVALNIVKYVIRTHKFLVIDNALSDKKYFNNEYIQKNKVKSVFCYPVIHKNKLVAVLYLENNLSTHVFTPSRIETINILSSQIAVSIENALLYKNLEVKVKQRTKELNQTNDKLQIIIKQVSKQKEELEENHQHITGSINYASRIQGAMLPREDLFKQYFAEHFIMFKPLDVVSGDFYWAKKIDNTLIYATADCTGHGVPGAFVSMLGMSLLNEIIGKNQNYAANKILEELRAAVKISLKQTEKQSLSKDGMDIALCVIDLKTNELQFSGAYNPLYIIRDGELINIKADRQPIGTHGREHAFTNHKIQLQKNDILYSFSDGYIDQFGGKNFRKFMSKKFRKLLLDIHDKPMNKQKIILETEFDKWRGKQEQIDDIVIIGTKI